MTGVRQGGATIRVVSSRALAPHQCSASRIIFAPINGKVVEINEALNDTPEKVNQDPYGDGWIAVVEVAEGTSFDDLMDSESYAAQVAKGGH